MKTKLKKIIISFILMIIFHLAGTYLYLLWDFGMYSPHVGILFVCGLIFGPYGAFGAALANAILDLNSGLSAIEVLPSVAVSFGVSYLAYKIWYSGFISKNITKQKLDSVEHLVLFIADIIICGAVYSCYHGVLSKFTYPGLEHYLTRVYFMDFINIAFIFGIIAILISRKINYAHVPKTSRKHYNEKLYHALFILLVFFTITTGISSALKLNYMIIIGELIVMPVLLFAYLTKPFTYTLDLNDTKSILEDILTIFLITTLIIASLGIIASFSIYYTPVINIYYIEQHMPILSLLLISDLITILFFIPGIIIIKYLEKKITTPIKAFSEIEEFIEEDEKIEGEGLVKIYSDYINEKDEIGKLARSYTDLINHNNKYIENIHKIESEKERMKAELDIATRIQIATLPNTSIENEYYNVNGYSKPAKEVGGDFFDYYEIDDNNLAIVIGDASGKGIPAALLALITQVLMKHILKHEQNPSKILYSLNNQLYEKNLETMFITLWLGIYNKKNKTLTFSNAGHNPPLINKNKEFEYLNMDSGIVLGIIENYEFINEEITQLNELILYTDGITDAVNKNNEMYGEDNLKLFINNLKNETDPIKALLNNINEFTDGSDQFDDMTLLYLKLK